MRNRDLDHSPFLSICITSYNRVSELYRCLASVDVANGDAIEIIISEDCSPRKKEIAQAVGQFMAETRYSVLYNSNSQNLGFDRNFAKLKELATGDHLLFITDDDTFLAGALDATMAALKTTECAAAFTPYLYDHNGALDRKYAKSMLIPPGIESVIKYLYSSILLSGLIFKRSRMVAYSAEEFENLIYSQVYQFASVLYRHGGCYIDVPLVRYIGDGENAFGLNASSEKNPLLADRKSIYSNLEYHKGLVRVVRIFDEENKTDLMRGFASEYSLKAYTGMKNARSVGRRELKIYWKKMSSLGIKLSLVAQVYYWALMIFGDRICDAVFGVPRAALLGMRRRLAAR